VISSMTAMATSSISDAAFTPSSALAQRLSPDYVGTTYVFLTPVNCTAARRPLGARLPQGLTCHQGMHGQASPPGSGADRHFGKVSYD
jgi:hypothetical protein